MEGGVEQRHRWLMAPLGGPPEPPSSPPSPAALQALVEKGALLSFAKKEAWPRAAAVGEQRYTGREAWSWSFSWCPGAGNGLGCTGLFSGGGHWAEDGRF